MYDYLKTKSGTVANLTEVLILLFNFFLILLFNFLIERETDNVLACFFHSLASVTTVRFVMALRSKEHNISDYISVMMYALRNLMKIRKYNRNEDSLGLSFKDLTFLDKLRRASLCSM